MNPFVERTYTKLTTLGLNVEGGINLLESISKGGRIDPTEFYEMVTWATLAGIAAGLLGSLLSDKNKRYETAVKTGLRAAGLMALYTGYLALKD